MKHGLSYTPEYRVWQTMRLRCKNPKNAAYPDYGGRGIKVCERWAESPARFIEDMGKKPSPRHEIDRINNDGNYEPGNCRWALRKENSNNRRSNRFIEHEGERKTVTQWAELLGISASVLEKRLAAGWPETRVLTTPVRPKGKKGQTTISQRLCVDCGKAGVGGARCRPCENQNRAKIRKPHD